MSERKIHPHSLANLTHEGRPPAFDEPKKRRYLSVTQTGWEGSQAMAHSVRCSGVSELLEKLGRGELELAEKHQKEVEDSAWMDSDVSNLGDFEPYEWQEGEIEAGLPVSYEPELGFVVVTE